MVAAMAVWIDRRWLERRLACKPQLELFAATFPVGCEPSRANVLAAGRAGLDLDWLAFEILSRPSRWAYVEARAPARRAYEEAKAPASLAYCEAAGAALSAWRRTEAMGRGRAYEVAMDVARRAYEEVRAPAWRAYMEAVAPALADALGLD